MAEELTYDPVVEGQSRQRVRLVGPLRPPPPGQALVLVPERGTALTVWPGEQVPGARLGVYRSTVLVDTGEHRLVLPLRLPCGDSDFTFHCRVTLLCRVVDPAAVVARGIRDIGSTVYGPVRALLTTAASAYGPTQAVAATAALNSALRGFTGDTVVQLRDAHVDVRVEAAPARSAPHTLRGEVLSRHDTPPDLNLLPGGAPASGTVGDTSPRASRPSRVRTSGGASPRRASRVRGGGAPPAGGRVGPRDDGDRTAGSGREAGPAGGARSGEGPVGGSAGDARNDEGREGGSAGGVRGAGEPRGTAAGGGQVGGLPDAWAVGERAGTDGAGRAGAGGRLRRGTRGPAGEAAGGADAGGAGRSGGGAGRAAAEGRLRSGSGARAGAGEGGGAESGDGESEEETWG